MQNLRDKLLKAGLISEGEARRPEPESRRSPPPSAPPRSGPPRHARPERSGGGGGRPERPERSDRPRGHGGHGGGGGGMGGAPIPKLPPLAVPGNKEFQRLEAKKQLELERKIRDMVLAAQVETGTGGHTFYFVTRKNRLRRLEMTPEMAGQLERGELAVVERPDPGQIEHAIVPSAVADEILTLQERSVRFYNRQGSPVGFLTDDELSRRQKIEADRGPEETEGAETSSDDAQQASAEGASAAPGPTASAEQVASAEQAPSSETTEAKS